MSNEYCGFNTYVVANGRQPEVNRGDGTKKVVDQPAVFSAGVSTSGTIVDLTQILQGNNVNTRTGDCVYIEKLFINYSVNSLSSDLFTNLRVIVFQWKPNTAISANPLPASTLQNVATYGIYNFYDWQFSNQFKILYDRVHSLVGNATSGASSGNQNWFGEIPLKGRAVKRIEFAFGSVNGSCKIYACFISDSAIAPFPQINFNSRLIYSEE